MAHFMLRACKQKEATCHKQLLCKTCIPKNQIFNLKFWRKGKEII